MKCPHCGVEIHEQFEHATFINGPELTGIGGREIAPKIMWTYDHLRCPACFDSIIYLSKYVGGYGRGRLLAYPKGFSRPVPIEVPNPYKADFLEACKVLTDSPKASAALSRRCLQAVLRDKALTKSKDLYDQIEEIINSKAVPSHISDGLHAVRQIGNIAAHSTKSMTTGEIVDVEPGEAEWNLDVLESLFDFYFVQPELSAKRKSALDKKLADAKKPPPKKP
jgi:hypothetical protein